LWQLPESVVYHMGGGTLAYGNPRKTYLNFRNSLINLQKNLPTSERFLKVGLRMMLDFPAAVKFLLHGSWADAWAVFRAHMSFYRLQSAIRRSRRASLSQPKPSRSLNGMFRGSILWVHVSGQKNGLSSFLRRQELKGEIKAHSMPDDKNTGQIQ